MATDPLSTATRTAKRNLLVASVLAITFKAFEVRIDKIPVAGLSIDFDNRLFSFLLLLATSYFLLTFALYYFIDIKNVERTLHQDRSDSTYNDRLQLLKQNFQFNTSDKLGKHLPAAHRIHLFSDGGMTSDPVGDALKANMVPSYTINQSFGRVVEQIKRDTKPDLYLMMDEALAKEWSLFKRQRIRLILQETIRWYAVAGAYTFRNYITDGALPIFLGLVAIATLLSWVNMKWLQNLAPV